MGKKKGFLTLLAAFLFLAFMTVGLGMLHASLVYLRIGAYRKHAFLCAFAAENGVKRGLHLLAARLSETGIRILSEEELAALEEDTRGGGLTAVEILAGPAPELAAAEEWEGLWWSSQSVFGPCAWSESDGFFSVLYDTGIASSGRLAGLPLAREMRLETELTVCGGRIPLPLWPLVIGRTPQAPAESSDPSTYGIKVIPGRSSLIPVEAVLTDQDILPCEATDLMAKALKVKMFDPGNLPGRQVRAALGLEVSDDPIPEGVYLVRDDLGLGGIYIEGTVDEMVLAVDGGSQVVSISQGDRRSILRFNPEAGKSEFKTMESWEQFDLIPRGIIISTGPISSLGGGTVDEEGIPVLDMDGLTPCLLSGVSLTIFSPDRISLSSHLLHQGVEWRDRLPFLERKDTQLNIFSSGESLEEDDRAGSIAIHVEAPQSLAVQASLTASGPGFSADGSREILLFGSLCAAGLDIGGTQVVLIPDRRFAGEPSLLRDAPRTAVPVLSAVSLQVREWR